MTTWPHTAAILAGGMSTRMGVGVRKESLRMADGRVMIEHVGEALAAYVERVVIVAGAHDPPPGPLPGREGESVVLPKLQRIHDLRDAAGPLGGIEALLASGIDEQYLVCPCDLPRIASDIIDALIKPTDAPATVVHIEGEDSPRPLPARLHASLLPMVREQLDAGRRSVHGLIERIDAHIVTLPPSAADALININTPEDAASLENGDRYNF